MKTYFSVTLLILLIALIVLTSNVSHAENVPNIMLRVVYVPPEWIKWTEIRGWTQAVPVKESEKLKYYEATIWEETASVYLYEFSNDFAPSSQVHLPINEQVAYREQFVRKKYTDMPADVPGINKDDRSHYLKDVFVNIASYLVKKHPHAEHHLTYSGHGAPGGDLFELMLNREHANAFLKQWTQELGKPLGVIDMGGPCNKAGFGDLVNFCEYARYYIASDMLNGGYDMDDWTYEKHKETDYDIQYHNVFAANQTLEEALRERLDLNRKSYEYSKNNMIQNSTQQATYLFSCKTFLEFYPQFLVFLRETQNRQNYDSHGDLFRFMMDNHAPQSLINLYHGTIVYSVDNKDFFEWTNEHNGMSLPHQDYLPSIYSRAINVSSDIIYFSLVRNTPIHVGDTFTVHLNVENVTDLAGWECDVEYDPAVLEADEVILSDFLDVGDVLSFSLPAAIDNVTGKITNINAARTALGGTSGTGSLFSITFTAKTVGDSRITISNLQAGTHEFETIPTEYPEIIISVVDIPDDTELNSVFFSCSIDEVPIYVLDTFTLNLNVEDATDFAGWFSDIVFDPAALEAIEVKEGEFLKEGNSETYFLKATIDNTFGEIKNVGSIRLKRDGVNGTGTMLSVTFTAKTVGDTHIRFVNPNAGTSDLQIIRLNSSACAITVEKRVFLPWDVNKDGQVDILDLMHVSKFLGRDVSFSLESDVDADGIIGILDLIVVAQHIGDTDGSAPSNRNANRVVRIESTELIPAMIQSWISQAMVQNGDSTVYREGIANLQKLLTSLMPKKTMLLHNYPNPFNPETWIPYQLSEAADVSVTIYAVNGRIVRTLVLGHQEAGEYKSRSRAAYWDGKNNSGELVTSGIYFYTLSSGDFTATRKMLILK